MRSCNECKKEKKMTQPLMIHLPNPNYNLLKQPTTDSPTGIADVALRNLPTPLHTIRRIDEDRTFTPVLSPEVAAPIYDEFAMRIYECRTSTSVPSSESSEPMDDESSFIESKDARPVHVDFASLFTTGKPQDPLIPHLPEEEALLAEREEMAVASALITEPRRPPLEELFSTMLGETTYQETTQTTQW